LWEKHGLVSSHFCFIFIDLKKKYSERLFQNLEGDKNLEPSRVRVIPYVPDSGLRAKK
jgi:hypothetical protein